MTQLEDTPLSQAQKRLMTWLAVLVIGGLALVIAGAFAVVLAMNVGDSGGTSEVAPLYAHCV